MTLSRESLIGLEPDGQFHSAHGYIQTQHLVQINLTALKTFILLGIPVNNLVNNNKQIIGNPRHLFL